MKPSLKEKGAVRSYHSGPNIPTLPHYCTQNWINLRAERGELIHAEEGTFAGQLSLRGLLRENREIARMNEPD